MSKHTASHLNHCYHHLSSFVSQERCHLLFHIGVPHPGQNGLLDLQAKSNYRNDVCMPGCNKLQMHMSHVLSHCHIDCSPVIMHWCFAVKHVSKNAPNKGYLSIFV